MFSFSGTILVCERLTDRQMDKSNGTMRHVRSGKNTRLIGKILHIFPLAPKVWDIGDPKRLTRVRPNLVVIDQLW